MNRLRAYARAARLIALIACAVPLSADGQTPQDPYQALTQRVQTQLRFTTDFGFPGGPNLQVKVYDWLIAPRQEIANFPLEGLATIEVVSGEFEATIDGVTSLRREGEHWVVPQGSRLGLTIRANTGRGDNFVSLHGVVVIRR